MPVPAAPHVLANGPSRSDAQRNRDRIIDVAQSALDADPDVALRAIAKKAGVGQGTLYRNFPDREALLWAVYHREVERLVDAGDELLERLPAFPARHEWVRRLGLFAVANTNLGPAMHRSIARTNDPARPATTGVPPLCRPCSRPTGVQARFDPTSPSTTSSSPLPAFGKSTTRNRRCARPAPSDSSTS